jgi:hypothetical protein
LAHINPVWFTYPSIFFSSSFTTCRIGLALHRLHRLADEEAEQRFLAALILGDLVGIGGEDFGDGRLDGAGIGLLEAPLLDNLSSCLRCLSMISKDLLGNRCPRCVPSATSASSSAPAPG